MNTLETFLWGLLGALIVELAGICRRARSGRPLPVRYGSGYFWLIRCLVMVGGGLVALGYSLGGLGISPLLAANLGAATPLLLAELAQLTPRVESEAAPPPQHGDTARIIASNRPAES
jgi:hypothetical protein